MGDEIININISEYLYHYTTSETAIYYILKNRTLMFNSIMNTNDPRETNQFSWIFKVDKDIHAYREIQRKLDNIKKNSKVLCFSIDKDPTTNIMTHRDKGYALSRMWAQYSDNHTGVCLVFDKQRLLKDIKEVYKTNKISYDQVKYQDINYDAFTIKPEKFMRNIDSGVSAHIEKFKKELFFSKTENWKEEREYRIVLESSKREPFCVNISNSIQAVIIGEKFNDINLRNLKLSMNKGLKKVNLYRMIWNNGNPSLGKIVY